MKAPWSYVPALPAAAGIVSGILLSGFGLTAAGVFVGITAFVLLYLQRQHYLSFFPLFASIGALACSVGVTPGLPDALTGNESIYTARIVSASAGNENTSYIVEIIGDSSLVYKQPIKCSLTVFSVSNPVSPGSIVKMKCALQPLDDSPDVPYQSDMTDYLRSLDVVCTAAIPPSRLVIESDPKGLQAFVNKARNRMFDAIVCAPVSANVSGFLVAVILGDRMFLSPQTKSDYRTVGVSHLLAISGLHVGIIAAMIAFALFPFNIMRRGYVPKCIITIILVWLYAMIAGMTPSVQRAAVMLSVFMTVRLVSRGYSVYNSLLLSIVVILVLNPMSLYAPGFQLSVCAVASILVFTGAIPKRLMRHRTLYYATCMIVVPVSAMIGTGMISAYYFHSFPGMFLAANIVTGILFPIIITLGVICMFITMCGLEPVFIGHITDMIYYAMQYIIGLIANDGGGMVRGIFFSAWTLIPYFAAVVSLALAIYLRKIHILAVSAACLVFVHIVAAITAEKIPAAELYIPRRSSSSLLLARSGNSAWIFSPDDSISAYDLSAAQRRYEIYLQSRHCDSLTYMPASLSSRYLTKSGQIITIGEKRIAIVSDSIPVCADAVDFALIGAKYRGNIEDIRDACRPNAVLFTSGIHSSRRKRLERECRKHRIPHTNLRHTPLAITISQ